MNTLQSIFIDIFSILYFFASLPLVTYILILVFLMAIARGLWKLIKIYRKKKSNLIKLSLYILQGMVATYILWFVLFNFHTFRLI